MTVDLSVGSKNAGSRALMKQADGSFVCCRKMPLDDVSSFVRQVRDKILLLDHLGIVDAGAAGKVAEDLRKPLGLEKEGTPADGGAAPAGGTLAADGGPIESVVFRFLAVDDNDISRGCATRTSVRRSRHLVTGASFPIGLSTPSPSP